MSVAILGTGFFSFLVGFTCAWATFRRRGYALGWSHGESYGRASGYREAWLKQMRSRLRSPQPLEIPPPGFIVQPAVDPIDDHTW